MSFAKAAEELFVTPAALSYQIKSLEEHLGMALFQRLNRQVRLTEAGHALRPGVAEGFSALHDAVRAVARLADTRTLTITAGPGFTAKWLAPRMFPFAAAHPEIELRFVASLRIMDFARDRVDAAIRFGPGGDTGLFAEMLAPDWVTPLCIPDVAARISTPADLRDMTLIHDDSIAFLDPNPSWAAWFSTQGIAAGEIGGPRFSNADHAIDAAAESGGVVLGRASLAERDLAQGRLVAPFAAALDTGAQYRFVCPLGRETEPRIAAFRAWLTTEIASLNALAETFDIVTLSAAQSPQRSHFQQD